MSTDPTDRRVAVLRMLSASPDGLSDAALARELGDDVRPQTVNQLCRKLVAEGELERTDTRPILNRLPAPKRRSRKVAGGAAATKSTRSGDAKAPASASRRRGSMSRAKAVEAPNEPAATADSDQDASKTEASPGPEPTSVVEPTLAPQKATHGRRTRSAATSRATTVRDGGRPAEPAAPADSDQNASKIEASPGPEPTPAAVSSSTSGTSAKSKAGSTSRRRTADPGTPAEPAGDAATSAGAAPDVVDVTADSSETEASPETAASPTANGRASASRSRKSGGRKKATDGAVTTNATTPVDPGHEKASDVPASTPDTEAPGTEAADAIDATLGPPEYDVLQAWSRVVNVQALVAGWLVRSGGTLRSASADGNGPARDLVASLDGHDVHVEVTGWPADGARTHPTTIAGDWFSAAEQAAVQRRRAHPQARIVIALPDTRRYRALTEQRSASLAGTRAEVWFVDPAGAVHAR